MDDANNSKDLSRRALVLPPQPVSWTRRDVLLFANSIGCGADDLNYLYENHPGFSSFPTYPIVLSFKHTHNETIEFRDHFDTYINVPLPGVPRLDSRKVVDGGRSLSVLKPIPPSSNGRSFMFRTKVLDVSDKGNAGTVVTLEHELYEIGNSTGNEISYCTITEMPFYLGQGNWGGPRGGKPPEYNPPDRKATTMLTHEVPRTAHLLYRLNGDYNPLHADSEAAAEAGFDGVIMHGLYSWNVTCRLLMAEFTDRSATSLKEFRARFVKPVCPGDKLTIEAWVLDGASASTFPGWTEVRFQVKVNDNQLCLSHGRTLIKLRKARLPSKI